MSRFLVKEIGELTRNGSAGGAKQRRTHLQNLLLNMYESNTYLAGKEACPPHDWSFEFYNAMLFPGRVVKSKFCRKCHIVVWRELRPGE